MRRSTSASVGTKGNNKRGVVHGESEEGAEKIAEISKKKKDAPKQVSAVEAAAQEMETLMHEDAAPAKQPPQKHPLRLKRVMRLGLQPNDRKYWKIEERRLRRSKRLLMIKKRRQDWKMK